MVDKREAEELLMIEEADAWFEYLEATRDQSEPRYARGRAVGLGAPAASACARSARGARKLRPAAAVGRGRRPGEPGARCYPASEAYAKAFRHTPAARAPAPVGRTPLRARHEGDFTCHCPGSAATQRSRDEHGAVHAAAARGAPLDSLKHAAPTRRRPPRPAPDGQSTPRSRSAAAAAAADAAARSREPAAAAEAADGGAEPKPKRRRRREGRRSAEKPARAARPRASAAPQRAAAPPPRRAPLPKAKRELLVSVDVGEKRVAVLEDDRSPRSTSSGPERRSIAGNIYLGVVDNVLPGHGGRVRRDRPREERLPLRRRDRRPRARGPPPRGRKIQDLISAARRSSSRRSRTR